MCSSDLEIVSDQFELAIFLVRFPATGAVHHDEEPVQDAFTFMTERAEGLNWIR